MEEKIPSTLTEPMPLYDFSKVFDVAAALCAPRGINNGSPFVVIPDSYFVKDLESFMPNPIRKRAEVITTDSAGFIAYLLKHKDSDGTVIYADINSAESKFELLAVLDDNCTIPQWRDHTCAFSPRKAVEWNRWMSMNNKKMSQSDFATWLEDNLPDIASVDGMPTGAEILAMALDFEVNSDKKVRSKKNLQSGGVTFEFVDRENEESRTVMQVFERFTVGIPVFDGSNVGYPLVARLKYRESQGTITFWYELIRPDNVFKQAVTDVLGGISQNTDLLIIAGSPGL